MKIAYVHDGPVPSRMANAVHVMKMCTALANQGADVTLFCPLGEVEGNPYEIYGVEEKFKICHVAPSRLLRKVPLLNSMSLAHSMASKVKKQGFDFVFGRSTLAIFLLRNYRPFIYESHLLPANRYRLFAEGKIMRSHLFVNHVVITDGLKQDYLNTYSFTKESKITVLQDAADLAKEITDDTCPKEKSKELKIEKRPVIGYLGHLLPGKCMEILSQIARMRPQYDFHVVGGKQEWVDRWMNDERCQGLNNIKFYGYVDNKTIPYYYNLFEICVLPFSSQIVVGKFKNANIGRWTSPLKLFEAMSYGKPILTTNLPTIQEVLTDGKNCLMESENNIDGWCNKLDMLVSDEELRNNLGGAAKALFENKYTWDMRAAKVIKLFKDK